MDELVNKATSEYLLSPDIGVEFIKHCQHAVIAVNNKAEIIMVNRSAELIFGYHKSELIGQKIEILLPDELKEKHKSHRDGFMKGPRNRPMGANLELRAKHKDGTDIPIDINLIPVPSVGGMITVAEISKKVK